VTDSIRTISCGTREARQRLRSAHAYLEAAELILADNRDEFASVAAGNAILAGIAASDAICCKGIKKYCSKRRQTKARDTRRYSYDSWTLRMLHITDSTSSQKPTRKKHSSLLVSSSTAQPNFYNKALKNSQLDSFVKALPRCEDLLAVPLYNNFPLLAGPSIANPSEVDLAPLTSHGTGCNTGRYALSYGRTAKLWAKAVVLPSDPAY